MDGQVTKRSDERKDIKSAYIEYRAAGKGLSKLFKAAPKRALIVNVSKNGLSYRSTEPFPEKSQMQVTLILPGVKSHLQVRMEVRWCREERKMGTVAYTHVCGARFTEFSPEAWEVLSKFIKE